MKSANGKNKIKKGAVPMALSARKKEILKAVVDDYVNTAEPVGSRAVAARLKANVSSATVRNEMAELERLGYLEQPHTSAGRVPSGLGYRLYVDELMSVYGTKPIEVEPLVNTLSLRMGELDRLVSEAGRMVSELTGNPAIAVSPMMENESVRRFEVIQVDAETVVLVLVTTSDIIKNRICRLTFPLSPLEINAANRALNANFTNIPLEQLTDERITAAEYGAGADITEILIAAIDFASEVLKNLLRRNVYLEGASQILKFPEFHEPGKAMALLDCLTDRELLSQLPAPDEDNPVKISIGDENSPSPLKNASIIMTSYHTPRGAKGLLGVVGPTRMDYSRVSARLYHFAEELNHLLDSNNRR
jgi:heat-inducible transcriptional repressor